jgi:hypothetical protein
MSKTLDLPLELIDHIYQFSDIDTKISLQHALPTFAFYRSKLVIDEMLTIKLDLVNIIKATRYEINQLILSLRQYENALEDTDL